MAGAQSIPGSRSSNQPQKYLSDGSVYCPKCLNEKVKFLKIMGQSGVHCPKCINEFKVMEGQRYEDFMARQRYLENSSYSSFRSLATSIQSDPSFIPCDSSFNLRNFIQEQRKIVTSLRSQPWSMQNKVEAVTTFKENIHRCVPQMNIIDAVRDKTFKFFTRIRDKFSNYILLLAIWRATIKRIEGNFGTSVGAYFILVRWLSGLNFLLFVMTTSFIILPQFLAGYGLDVPPSVQQNSSAFSYIIDGKGYQFEYSLLFIGFYDSGQREPFIGPPSNPNPHIGIGYKLPLAYILTILTVFILSGFCILFSMAKNYRVVQRSSLGEHYAFAWRVFTSWDYAVTDVKSVEIRRKNHAISLREALFEVGKEMDDEETLVKLKLLVVRVTTNFIIGILLIGTGYFIFLAAENANSVTNSQINFGGSYINQIVDLIRQFQLQIVIGLRNFLLPLIFQVSSHLEKLHPRNRLKLLLLRSSVESYVVSLLWMFILYFSSLYVVVISLFVLSRNCAENQTELRCRCWETSLGQELYKLMLSQIATEVCKVLFLDGTRWFLSKLIGPCGFVGTIFNKAIGLAEFDTPLNVLQLIYGQGLLLFGVLFCPFLPGIGLMRNVFIFYLRSFSVLVFNKPPKSLFQVASTHNFYMAILLVTVFICGLPVGYATAELTPSVRCGPFRGLTNMFEVVYIEASTWPSPIQGAWDYIQTATVTIPLIAVLCIVIYYYGALSASLKEINRDLIFQLKVEQSETRNIIAREREIASQSMADNAYLEGPRMDRYKTLSQYRFRQGATHYDDDGDGSSTSFHSYFSTDERNLNKSPLPQESKDPSIRRSPLPMNQNIPEMSLYQDDSMNPHRRRIGMEPSMEPSIQQESLV